MFGNSLQKECKIPQMGVWDGDTWIWNLAWRHNWFLWDHDLVATFMELIDNKKSIINKKDNWVWMNNSEGTYCVKHMYKSLLSQEGETEQHIDSKVWSTLWNIKASSKALAFSWSLLLNKIQSKVNLLDRGITLEENNTLCPFCNLVQEDDTYLFFSCNLSFAIWMCLYKWMSIEVGLPLTPFIHLVQHGQGIGKTKSNQIWKVVWVLWRHQNNIIFREGNPDF